MTSSTVRVHKIASSGVPGILDQPRNTEHCNMLVTICCATAAWLQRRRDQLLARTQGAEPFSLLVFCNGDDLLGDKLRHALAHAPADVHNHLSARVNQLL